MSSNPDLEKERQNASMPTIFSLGTSGSHEDHTEGNTLPDPSVSKELAIPQPNAEVSVPKLETALTAPKTITIQKPSTPAAASASATASTVSAVKGKGSTRRRQLQLLCVDGRVVAAPLTVGLPSTASAVSEKPPPQSATSTAPVSEEQPEAAAGEATAAFPTAPAASVVVDDHVGISQSVESASESLQPDAEPDQTEWVVEVQDISQPAGSVDGAERQMQVADTADGVQVINTVDAVHARGVVEAVKAVNRVEAVPRKSRLMLNSAESLAESSGAAAVLNAVESAAGSAAAVSHVVFESDGRAVGALMPAPGQDGQEGKRQVVLTGQQGDQQVVLAMDGNVLGTAGGGNGRQIVLEVDEASDSVTLLVDRLGKGAVYELAAEGGELLELWERNSDGEDRHLETVSEVSLVDIRAVCEQCGCVISHHMVGLLARDNGSEYGYRCRQCQCVQTDVDLMARHMDSHRPLADTQCRFCSRGLRTFRPETARTYTCHACQQVFATRHEMIRHREVHPPKRRFPCELCDKAFQMKVQLEVHMRTHLGHKPYACDMCPAAFTQPSHLINHRRTHTGERPYSCERCGRAFVQQGHLRAHERTHTGERPYKCDICDRGFRQSGQLTAHKKLHEGDTPLKLRRRHGEPILEDEITCPECKKMFRLPKDLKRHMLIHGKGAFKCDTCDRTFKRADHLRRHLRRHEKPTRQRQRRRFRPPTDGETGLQSHGLTLLDRVIDTVLDEPEGPEDVNAAFKLREDHGHLKVEQDESEGTDDYPDSDEAVDEHDGDQDHPDGGAESESRVCNSRVSRAPEDALWSQADCGDDVRWQRVDQQSGRRPVGGAAYGRRSRLHATFADDFVDEEMAMLTAALEERAVAGKQKRRRGATSESRHPPEPTVKLEPVDWEDWEPCETGGQRGEDEDRRGEDENWTGESWEGAGGKRKRRRDGGAKRAEDLVLAVWDDVDMTENATSGTGRQSTARSREFSDQVLRTSRRSTAGNRAANVGVSLSRTSHRGGKR